MCPSSSMMHPVGRLIAGRFQLEALAGSGGMGTVYRARDLLNDRPAAIKLLQSGTGPGDGRFAQEAALLATLSHPGIVRYIAHGVTPEGQNFLAMEWLEGEDLSVRLRRGPLPLSASVTLLRRVAEALAMAHGRGVVHRDLKPANLFLRRGLIERVTLLDFGIAHHAEARAALTRTGVVLGTPEYMSPEQARGQREISPAADIFSLGCVIYECVTGRPPFLADHIAATLAKVLFDELRPARALRPDVPEELDSLLGLMLAKSPQGRLVDAAALLRALQALEHLQLSDAEPVVGTPSQPPALTDVEQFLLSIVVATPTQARQERAQTLRPDDLARLAAQQQALAEVLGAFRLRAEWLVNGTLVAALEPGADAHDQVAQAARCALLLRERWPEAQVALATGYGRLRETSVLGEVLDRAEDFDVQRDHVRLLKACAARLAPGGLIEGDALLYSWELNDCGAAAGPRSSSAVAAFLEFAMELILLLIHLFLAIALVGVIPGVLIYTVSYQFVARSIDGWFDQQVAGALDAGLALGRGTLDALRAEVDSLLSRSRAEHVDFAWLNTAGVQGYDAGTASPASPAPARHNLRPAHEAGFFGQPQVRHGERMHVVERRHRHLGEARFFAQRINFIR